MKKKNKFVILGIETSCDETAASLLEIKRDKVKILSNIVSSQIKVHQKYGGVVPELAAREHLKNIIPVLEEALRDLGPKAQNLWPIDAIAVTTGPGLITSLLIGVEAAKTLALAWQKPLIPINHLEGHIYANWLSPISSNHKSDPRLDRGLNPKQIPNPKSQIPNCFPILCLIISGGHTELVLMKNHHQYEKLGQTLDDAVGECFDKVAKMLNIGYPGGPIIEKLAKKGNSLFYKLPSPMIESKDFNFSFSGLKTAVLYLSQDKFFKKGRLIISPTQLADLCASFQQAVFEVLTEKTLSAAQKYGVKNIYLAGGVAANRSLREFFANKIKERNFKINFSYPELKFCTDNAAMIAMAGYFHFLVKDFTPWQKIKPDPNLEIV